MLNENLMDSKDIIIAKLKLAIKEFQEYDIERKKRHSMIKRLQLKIKAMS